MVMASGSKLASKQIQCDVAIVGGGLGGLALAAGLVGRGYDVRLYEAAPALRTGTGTVLAASGNGFTALDKLHPAIVPQLKARGSRIHSFQRYSKVRTDQPAEVTSLPSRGELYVLQWAVVQQVLASLVPNERVQCGYRAVGYTESADEGFVSVHFKDKPDMCARLVVAADGVRSALRATMLPDDPGPRYLRHMNWNALLYNPDRSVVDAHGPGELQVWQDAPGFAVPSGSFKHLVMVIDAGDGYTFWQLRVVSEHPSFTPPPEEHVGSTAATQLSRDETHFRSEPEKAYLVGGGLGRPGSKAHVMKLLEAAGFDRTLALVQATPEADIFERAMLDRLPLDELGGHLSSPSGRVILLGDAAHAMHSGPGQGARTAFEDAHTLLDILERHNEELKHSGWMLSPISITSTKQSTSTGKSSSINDDKDMAVGVQHEFADAVVKLELHDKDAEGTAVDGSDHAIVQTVACEYEAARLVRVSRIQRVAAEGCGLDAIKQQVAPKGLTTEQRAQRSQEFSRWIEQYPDNPQGDPQSTYWKPPAPKKN